MHPSVSYLYCVILSPSGDYDPEGLSIQSPVMLLGTSSDQAPTSQRLAEIYNRLSGEKIAPNGLSYTSQSGNCRLRVVSASLDAYQTFSDDTLQAVSDWYENSAGVRMGDPGADSLLRLASWTLGIGGLLLLLVMLLKVKPGPEKLYVNQVAASKADASDSNAPEQTEKTQTEQNMGDVQDGSNDH